jgi:ERCC4-type nuclease
MQKNSGYTIDCREHGLIELYRKEQQNIVTAALSVGDIMLKHGEYELLLERKTVADLISSIKDGRYREQKLRLQAYCAVESQRRRVGYILEGNAVTVEEQNMMWGFIISCNYRDNIPVFQTSTLIGTKYFIDKLLSRLIKNSSEFWQNASAVVEGHREAPPVHGGNGGAMSPPMSKEDNDIRTIKISDSREYVSVIKLKKKENLTPATWWNLALAQVPGVSTSIAQMIMVVYPTMHSLYVAYAAPELTETQRELLLSDIKISHSAGARKLGKIISTRIYKFINSQS